MKAQNHTNVLSIVILLKIWGPSDSLLEEGVDFTYYKGYTDENLATFCHTFGWS